MTPQVDDASLLKDGTNELSVSVTGKKGILSVNGTKIADFTGDPPPGGSAIGFVLHVNKADTMPVTITLKSVSAREVGVAR